MKQDEKATEKAYKRKLGPIEFPAIAYLESEDEDILSAYFMMSDSEQSYIDNGEDEEVVDEGFVTENNEIFRKTLGSQSTSKIFFVENATMSDFKRIRDKAKEYKPSTSAEETRTAKP